MPPAFHSTHGPSSFYPREAHSGQVIMEERFDLSVPAGLEGRGHDLVVGDICSEGRISAVARDAA